MSEARMTCRTRSIFESGKKTFQLTRIALVTYFRGVFCYLFVDISGKVKVEFKSFTSGLCFPAHFQQEFFLALHPGVLSAAGLDQPLFPH